MTQIIVYTARRIHTMDPGRPHATAIAVMDGKVLSTGTLESMKPWLDRHPFVVDNTLIDKVIVPGFIDPHTHFYVSSGYMGLHYVGPIESIGTEGTSPGLLTADDVVEKIRAVCANEPDKNAALCFWGLDPAAQGIEFDRNSLDAIVGDRPVWVITYAPHFVYLSSAALARLDIDDSCDVHGVMHYPDGRLSGVFAELDAKRIAFAAMQKELNRGAGAPGLRRMAEVARRAGVTTTAEMLWGYINPDVEWQAHNEAVNHPDFPLRMGLVPVENAAYRRLGEGAAEWIASLAPRSTDKLFFHGVKFLSDGSFPALSSRLNFPGYLDGSNGLRNDVPYDQMAARMLPFWQRNIPIHCHANGDEALDATLNALAQLQEAKPRFDHRFTVEHYTINNPMQARRLKALGGLASVNNYFVHYRSQLHSEKGYGPDRSEAVARLATLEREGVTFALHSDSWLVVVPLHPLTAVWCAVNRLALDGKTVVAPGECIGIERAMRAVTIDAAYVIGKENELGSLEPGKHADFAILEEDPYEVDAVRIRDIRVWGTALGGKLQPA
ncbi:MAG: amidohydrolase [Variovorax paradoxus]|uniref:Amidohydrolase n=1 Tax=Variovorax paradoxus TaxID=34073 RepID=A0A2W5SCU8_VARPD|nr:MAG: amidohydrolase [Variovorax paradoxus]